MECKDALKKMNARIDGELPGKSAEALDRHIAGCKSCRQAVRELQDVVQILNRYEPQMPGTGLEAVTLSRFETEVKAGENKEWWRNHVFDKEGLIDLFYPL